MTTTVETTTLVGPGVDRVDGPRKVTGAARYPSDFDLPDLAYAALVRSTIAAGTIAGIDTGAAESAPGVLAVLTHKNAPTLHRGRRNRRRTVLQSRTGGTQQRAGRDRCRVWCRGSSVPRSFRP
jgi:CO/xanthine dehydrogenase Mo-binding subunit